ncbi:MAG: cyclic pyranopterin monophosphate synthase MoaC [Actinomycetota bacterium]|nr:cyclic pyranopterin monophosphate synthase MoaC [Actinomycetota bacterium]MDP2287242.1 cyclic pyranopterin monophosphate synthase MoaC [Actinomycetota bacterium]
MTTDKLTHLDDEGHARMVDVTEKSIAVRKATASARVRMAKSTIALLRDGQLPKGDALAVARVAGIMAAKRAHELIPLCHPIAIHGVEVDLVIGEESVDVSATVRTADRTGVEMEALTAASVSALTMIDMIKGVDRLAYIDALQVDSKEGGRSGTWIRP